MANVNEEVLRLTLDDSSFRKGIQQITVSLEQLKKALNIKEVDSFDKLDKAVKKVKFDELSKSAEKMSDSVAKSSKTAVKNMDDMGKSGKKSVDSIEKASDEVKFTGIKKGADSAAEAVRNSAKLANDSINGIGANAKGLKSASAAAAELNRNVQNVKLNPLQRAMQALHDVGVKVHNAFSNLFSKFSFGNASSEVDSFKLKLSALSVVGVTAISKLTDAAINFGQRAFHSMIQGITDGFHEYETQMDAIQTIYANTSINGTNMTQITRALNDLNTYADKTIYNFTQMTHNIGMFTAAGVGLQDSVTAIKGIANWAAMCGSNAAQANTAMYQLSQSLATGSLKLQDWNSVVNAGMGGKQLQDALLRTAVHLKKIDWKTAAAYAKDFRQTLQEGWATTEVVSETFKQLTMDVSDYGKAVASLVQQGYTQKEAETIVKLAQNSQEAATKVKTFTQLIDTLREAVGSGWTESWSIVVGDLDEAKELYSNISDAFGAMIADNAKRRNDLLRSGLSSGYKQIVQAGIADTEVFTNSLTKFGNIALKSSGKTVEGLVKQYGTFEKSMHSGWVTADVLKKAVAETAKTVNGYSAAKRTELGITNDQVKAMNALNDGLQKGTISAEAYVKKMRQLSGRENIIAGFANIARDIKAVFTTITNAWHSVVKPMSNNSWLYDLTVGFRKFTEVLTPSKETLLAIGRVTKVVAHAFVVLKGIVGVIAKIFGSGLKIAFKSVGVVLAGIAAVINTIGDCIHALAATSAWHNVVNIWSNSVAILKTIVTGFKSGVDGIFDSICRVITNAFKALPSVISGSILSMNSIFGKFKAAGNKCGNAFGSGLESMNSRTKKSMDTISKGMAAFHAGMARLGSKIREFGSSVARVFGKIDFFSIFERLVHLFKEGALTALLWNIGKFIKGLNAKSEELQDSTFVAAIRKVLDDVSSSFKDFVKQFKVTALLTIAGSIALLANALHQLADIPTKKLAPALGAMGGITTILVAASGVLAYMSKFQTKVGKHGRDSMFDFSAINKCAVGFAALGFAVKQIAQGVASLKGMDPKAIGAGFTGVVAVIASMAGVAKYLSKINPETIANVGKMMLSFGGAFVILGIGMFIVSKAIASFGKMSLKEIVQGFIGFTIAFAELAGVIVGLNFIKFKRRKMLTMAEDILIISIAMIPLAKAIKILGSMSVGSLITGLIGLKGAMIAVGAFMIAMNWLTVSNGANGGMLKVGGQLMMVAIALNLIAKPVAAFSRIDYFSLGKGLGAVISLLTIVTVAMIAMNHLNGDAALKSSGALILMATAIRLLAGPIKTFANMNFWSLAQGLGGMAIALYAMVKALHSVNGIDATAAIPIAAIAGSLFIMAKAMKAFNGVSWESIGKGLVMLASSVVGLLVVGAIASKAGLGLEALGVAMRNVGIGAVALAASFYIIVKSIVLLRKANISLQEVLTNIGTALATVLPTIAKALVNALVNMVKEFANSIPELLDTVGVVLDALCKFVVTKSPEFCEAIMTFLDNAIAAIANHADAITENLVRIIAAALKALAGHMPEMASSIGDIFTAIFDTIGAGLKQMDPGRLTSMLLSFGIMATLFHVMAKMKKDIKGALMVGGSMIALMYAMAGVFAILGTIDAKQLYAAVIAINGTFIAMTITFKILSTMKGSVAKALPVIGIMALVIGGLGLIFGLLSSIDGTNALKMAGAMSLTLLAISGAMAICSLVNPVGALSAVGAIAVFIAGLAVIVAAAGGLRQIPGATWLVNEGGKFLQAIGEALGKFAAGIMVGISSGIAASLKVLGKALSGFMKDIGPFLAGVKKIDGGMVTNVGCLALIVAAVGASSFIAAITDFLTGGNAYKKFGQSLVTLAQGIKSFLAEMEGVDTDRLNTCVEPLKKLQEIVDAIPPAGGMLQAITGAKSWANLSDGLVEMAKTLKAFGDAVADVNTEAINGAVPAMKGLSDVINSLPSADGLAQALAGSKEWKTLSTDLPDLGNALKTFGENVKGTDSAAIQSALPATRALIDVLKALPDNDGLFQKMTGFKEWKTLSNGLVDMGKALTAFGNSVKTVDAGSISKAIPAMQSLVGVLSVIPSSDGFWQQFEGVKKWSTLSNGLVDMGKSLNGYSKAVDGINVGAIQSSKDALIALTSGLDHINKKGGIFQWFTGDTDYSGFARAAGQIAQLMSTLSSIKPVNTGVIDNVKNCIDKINGLSKSSVDINNINSLKIGVNIIGDTVDSISSTLSRIDTASLLIKVNNVKQLISDVSGIGATQFSPLSLLPVSNAIDTISKCVNKLNGITINQFAVSSISTQLGVLVKAISSVPASLSVDSLSRAMNTISALPLEAVGTKFIMGGNTIKNGVSTITSALSSGGKAIQAGIASLTNILNGLHVSSNVASQMKAISGSINSGANNVTNSVKRLIGTLSSNASAIGGAVRRWIGPLSSALGSVASTISSKAGAMRSSGSYLGDAIVSGMRNAADRLGSVVYGIVSSAASSARSGRGGFYDAGRNLGWGLVDGLDSMASYVASTAWELGHRAAVNVRRGAEVRSPSRYTRRVGKFIDEGLILGMKDNLKGVASTANMIGSKSVEEIKNAMSSLNGITMDDLNVNPVITPVMDLSGFKEQAKLANSLLDTKVDLTPRPIALSKIATVPTSIQNGNNSNDNGDQSVVNNYTFNQTNNSPKALDRFAIYRNTRTQFEQFRQMEKIRS